MRSNFCNSAAGIIHVFNGTSATAFEIGIADDVGSTFVVDGLSESKSTDRVLNTDAGVVYADGLVFRVSASRIRIARMAGLGATM